MRRRSAKLIDGAKQRARRILKETDKRADRLIFVPIIIYAVAFSIYTCYMHYIFKTFAWDLSRAPPRK